MSFKCIFWFLGIDYHSLFCSASRCKTNLHSSGDPVGDVNDFERQLQQLFDTVKTMIKMGKEKDANDLLQANYEAVKEQIDAGAKGIEQAAILDIVVLGYLLVGDLKFIRSLLDMVTPLLHEYCIYITLFLQILFASK